MHRRNCSSSSSNNKITDILTIKMPTIDRKRCKMYNNKISINRYSNNSNRWFRLFTCSVLIRNADDKMSFNSADRRKENLFILWKSTFQVFQQQPRGFVPITSYQNDVNYDGSYTYSYISADGSQQQARGFVKNLGQKEIEAQVVQGNCFHHVQRVEWLSMKHEKIK